MADDPAESDPFEGWKLDDDFVGGARYQEGSARDRAREQRRQIEADRHAQQWREKQERKQRRDDRRAGPGGHSNPYGTSASSNSSPAGKTRWRGMFVLILLGAILAWNVFGRGGGSTSGGLFGQHADALNIQGVITDFPSPSKEESDEPLGHPTALPLEEGAYAFIATQSGGSRPVAYDPCRPIHVVINDRTLPIGGDVLVQQALDDVTSVSGLQFVVDGKSDEEPTDERPPVDEERYGDRWAPVLIAWTDPVMTKDLAGNTAGFGGSQQISKGSGDTIYTTGTVALDGPQFIDIMRRPDGQAIGLAIIRHELGHLVGLDHVDDPNEIMYPESGDTNTKFGPGDTTGLSLLGRGKCRSDL